MAVYAATSADYLTGDGSVLDPAQDWTDAGWFWFGSATSTYRNLMDWDGASPESFTPPFLGIFTDNAPEIYAGADPGAGEVDTSTDPEVATTWVYLAVRYKASTTELSFVVNGVQIGAAVVVDLSAVPAPASKYTLGDGVGDGDAGVGYRRTWQRWVTVGELATESASRSAVLTTNLLADDPLERHTSLGSWTAVGTLATMSGPLNIDNNTAATATVITSLPYSVVQNTKDHAQDTEGGTDGYAAAWWTYTPVTCDQYLGLGQDNDFAPIMTVFSGAPGSLVQVGQVIGYPTGSQVIRLDTGVDYYILIEAETGALDGGIVTLSAERQPNQLIPAGSLAFVTFDGGIWFMSSTTGDVLSIRQLPTTLYGGYVDARSAGQILVMNPGSYNTKAGAAFSGALALLADDITTPAPNTQDAAFHSADTSSYLPVPNDGVGTFQTTLTKISAAGVASTTWAIPSPAAGASLSDPTMLCVAVNAAGTIAYYVDGTVSAYPYNVVKRWDLTNDLALADFVTVLPDPSGGDSYSYVIKDLLVLASGDVLVAAEWLGVLAPVQPTNIVNRYDSSGTLLATIVLTTTSAAGDSIYLAADATDATAFWAAWADTGVQLNAWKINSATMTAPVTLSWPYTPDAEAPFNPPIRLPIYVTRTDLAPCGSLPPAPAVPTQRIRFLRQFGHFSEENFWLFWKRVELLLETGTAPITGDGSDPLIAISWSNDYGHTWSPEVQLSMGQTGEYRKRVFLNNVGQSRDRVWRIVCTEPIALTLIQMTADVQKGRS